MTVGDILALAEPGTQIVVYGQDGRMYYVGPAEEARAFDGWEPVSITVDKNRLILLCFDTV